jgi:hypothetical protein
MPESPIGRRPGLFFVVGPLRTGSSLMARCIDDHPAAICLCESEIHRALFDDYFLELHSEHMVAHGLTPAEVVHYLDRKKQDDIGSWLDWYEDVAPRLAALYGKHYVAAFGDKSPDFYRCPGVLAHLAENYPLIYTVRDPRAILRSIMSQKDTLEKDKAERWEAFLQNYLAWKPYLDASKLLVTRYEDLVTAPAKTMQDVYAYLDLPSSMRFLEPFPRPFPLRFLWETTVSLESGHGREFDPARIMAWKSSLDDERLGLVYSNSTVLDFMSRFGYET